MITAWKDFTEEVKWKQKFEKRKKKMLEKIIYVGNPICVIFLAVALTM